MTRIVSLWIALAGVNAAMAGPSPVPTRQELEAAPALEVRKLVEPVRTMRLHGNILVPHADGSGWDYLLFYKYQKEPTQVFLIDLMTGQATKQHLPAGYSTPWSHAVSPDGRLFISFWPGGGPVVVVYDPATKKLIDLGAVCRGAASTEAVARGTDGKIYVSTFNQVHAIQFDPATLQSTDYGLQGPKRDYLAYGYSIAADDRYVYTAAGKIPWTLVAYDRQTKQQEVLLQTTGGNHLAVQQGRYGCTASINHQEGPDKGRTATYWLYQGKAIPRRSATEAPPWTEPADAKAAAASPIPKPEVFLDRAVPSPDGSAEFWYRLPPNPTSKPKTSPAASGSESTGWKRVALPVDVTPIQTSRLVEMPDGRLFGTADAYQGHFIFDPRTGQSEFLGQIHLSHYGTAFAGGKIFLSGYPSSQLFEYDPARPWTPGHGTPEKPAPPENAPSSNPRRLLYFAPITLTHHLKFVVTGADGKIYGGGHAERAHVGGGLGWWDPKTGKAGGLREPFELFDVAGLCTANGAHQVVYSSSMVKDPLTRKRPAQAKLFVFDVDQQKIVREIEPLPGGATTGLIVEGLPGKVLGAANGKTETNSVLYQVDIASGRVDFSREIPGRFGGDYRRGPDGAIWTFLDADPSTPGTALVRILPADGRIVVVGKVERGGRIAFSGRDVYLSGEPALREIAGIVSPPNQPDRR